MQRLKILEHAQVIMCTLLPNISKNNIKNVYLHYAVKSYDIHSPIANTLQLIYTRASQVKCKSMISLTLALNMDVDTAEIHQVDAFGPR